MRDLFGTAAALAVVGGIVLAAAPAIAGPDEAQQDSFWNHQSVSDPAYAHHGAYMTMDPRDAKVDPNASTANAADASNPQFNHAEGTMSGPAVAEAPVADNGRYTASYRQYMQVEARDAKVAPKADSSDDDMVFYHAMGTMSHP